MPPIESCPVIKAQSSQYFQSSTSQYYYHYYYFSSLEHFCIRMQGTVVSILTSLGRKYLPTQMWKIESKIPFGSIVIQISSRHNRVLSTIRYFQVQIQMPNYQPCQESNCGLSIQGISRFILDIKDYNKSMLGCPF